jgi:selenoprotein W-related protein
MAGLDRVRVEIEYCVACRWMLRASWIAQELLTTFEAELDEVALVPARASGVFIVREGGFPELSELKRRLRDRIAPGRSLGHSDRSATRPAGRSGEADR